MLKNTGRYFLCRATAAIGNSIAYSKTCFITELLITRAFLILSGEKCVLPGVVNRIGITGKTDIKHAEPANAARPILAHARDEAILWNLDLTIQDPGWKNTIFPIPPGKRW